LNGSRSGKNASELALRVISALVLAAIALALLYVGGISFAVLCAVGALLILLEFRTIVLLRLSRELAWAMLAFLALAIALWFGAGPDHAFAALAGGVVVLALWEIIISRSAWAATGLAYSGLPFLALVLLRDESFAGAMVVLLVFAVSWGADILAYFAGRTFGGPKLAPRISPKKTWSGFFGGIAGSLILCAGVALVFDLAFGIGLALLIVIASIANQVGDLFESWIKRHFAVKDSGAIIPGHGGVMDRLDGLVFVAVTVWLIGVAAGGQALQPGSAATAFASRFLGA
jgi:phosphatidate cytidylyltransferase